MTKLILGDCLDVMRRASENSIDAIITDPPYGLEFMGKDWDKGVPGVHFWQEMIRVLKPGGHLLAFGGTRTYHRMAVAIEDAGFEVRDMIEWVYGSGFPKSLNIGKAVDKLQGNEREITDRRDVGHDITNNAYKDAKPERKIMDITKGTSKYEGWGTALKPAHEPICMARKPLAEKTVAENCLKWGTGGINIDESRVEGKKPDTIRGAGGQHGKYSELPAQGRIIDDGLGRFPANLIHDNSEEVRECFPDTKSGAMNGTYKNTMMKGKPGTRDGKEIHLYQEASSGNASRFFKSIIYQAKASKSGRGEGNNHPTVKPIALMEYLIKMVTPKGGRVLDPFMGSGSTGVACKNLGYDFVGIELDPNYLEIAKARINNA